MTSDGRGSVFFDVFVLGQRIRQLLAEGMATAPIRPEEYAVYSVVFEDEAVSPTAMAARLSMPLTTVMDHVRAMEERGHAHRMPNPRDGRSYLMVLTAAGRRAHHRANLLFERVYADFVAALPLGEGTARAHLEQLLLAAEAALLSQRGSRSEAPTTPG